MNLCLDVRYRVESGASSYIKNVVPRLLQLAPEHTYHLLKYPFQTFEFESAFQTTILSPTNGVAFTAWDAAVLPRQLSRLEIDVYHGMKAPGPYFNPVKTVCNMHSITNKKYKGYFPLPLKTRLYCHYSNAVTRRSDRVIAVSEFIRDYLIECLRVDPTRIDVIRHGVDPSFTPSDQGAMRAIRERFSIDREYLLCVGNVTPVKNFATAVQVLGELAQETDLHLVIAGGLDHPYAGKLATAVDALGLGGRVKLLGFVDRVDLPPLMSGASALLMPSLTEGCPVTMLEAFGTGVPVVASGRGGLRELGDGCALLVEDPMDYRSIADAVRRLLGSPDLASELRGRARAKAGRHTWELAAEAHLAAYTRSMGSSE